MDDEENDSQARAGAKRLSSDADADAASNTTKPPPRKRRRKRRKVVIDNHETELTNDHIRTMLQHSDDIVVVMIHPASLWDEEEHYNSGNSSSRKDYKTLVWEERAKLDKIQQEGCSKSSSKRKKKNGSKEDTMPCLTRPFLADGNGPPLHPVLQKLWKDNYWKALGEPCPYQKQQVEAKDEEVVADVEKVRRDARGDDDDESTLGGEGSDLDVTKEKMDDENMSQSNNSQVAEDDFEFPTAVDDDDEEEEEQDAQFPDFGDDEDEATAALQKGSNNNNNDFLDLGMVNDMILDSDEDDGDEDTNRQALGELSSSSTKWHKHTVRVFQHLKKCLHDPNTNTNTNAGGANDNNVDSDSDNNDADPDADDKSSTEQTPQQKRAQQQQQQLQLPEKVGFDELTKHVVSRRNASSIFFEMLQLKTWDFIELDQDESYGTIAISAGVRFGEDAPNN
jgi:hypothetical protein